MKKIRQSVFETNSSAMHSLVFERKIKLEESDLQLDNKGRIKVKFIDFSKKPRKYIYKTQQDKLNYLATYLVLYNFRYIADVITDFGCFISDAIVYLEKIQEHAGASGFVLDKKSPLPYSSEPMCEDLTRYIWDTKCEEFVFDKDVSVAIEWD